MEFKELQLENEEECLKDALIDLDTEFARKTNTPTLKEKDFVTKWERTGKNNINKKMLCGTKGISMSKIENVSKEQIIENYVEAFKISPRYKDGLLIFKFLDGAGLVKPKPSKRIINHHDFYKSDDFDLNKISTKELLKLKDYVSNQKA